MRHGLIVDNFAGGGGASTGIEQATGRPVDIAINHDPVAIAMHEANHPYTRHYCEDVWEVDPIEATQGRPVALCWLSPDCKHFSKAKGGQPVEKRIRALAWVAVRWAATVRPRVIILENVEEFQTWGPVVDGRPCPKRRGKTFRAFIHALKRHGYRVETRELRACDYGAPTIRKRLFLIARCDGRPIVWPEPTHGDPGSLEVAAGLLKPWRTAADIIDWSLPVPSVFERKRPLAESTMRRIARGIQRFVVENPRPFIIKVNHHGAEFRSQSLDEPLRTITAKNGWAIVTSHIIKFKGTNKGANIGHRTDEPLHTITAGGTHLGEVRTYLQRYYHGESGQMADLGLGVITVRGEKYQIADIGMRMLEPHELFTAQGFPPDYIIDRGPDGRRLSKAEQVRMCGNAVPPPFAKALVEANLPELCRRESGVAMNA